MYNKNECKPVLKLLIIRCKIRNRSLRRKTCKQFVDNSRMNGVPSVSHSKTPLFVCSMCITERSSSFVKKGSTEFSLVVVDLVKCYSTGVEPCTNKILGR